MLQPSSISLLVGFEFPTRVLTCALSGLVPSVQVALFPLSWVFFALSSPPTLVLAVEREKKKSVFIFDATEATCINPFFFFLWRDPF